MLFLEGSSGSGSGPGSRTEVEVRVQVWVAVCFFWRGGVPVRVRAGLVMLVCAQAGTSYP